MRDERFTTADILCLRIICALVIGLTAISLFHSYKMGGDNFICNELNNAVAQCADINFESKECQTVKRAVLNKTIKCL